MFYVQIFNNFGEKKSLTMRYGPSTGNTWEQVMGYAQFLRTMYNIRVFVKIFDENEDLTKIRKKLFQELNSGEVA